MKEKIYTTICIQSINEKKTTSTEVDTIAIFLVWEEWVRCIVVSGFKKRPVYVWM